MLSYKSPVEALLGCYACNEAFDALFASCNQYDPLRSAADGPIELREKPTTEKGEKEAGERPEMNLDDCFDL